MSGKKFIVKTTDIQYLDPVINTPIFATLYDVVQIAFSDEVFAAMKSFFNAVGEQSTFPMIFNLPCDFSTYVTEKAFMDLPEQEKGDRLVRSKDGAPYRERNYYLYVDAVFSIAQDGRVSVWVKPSNEGHDMLVTLDVSLAKKPQQVVYEIYIPDFQDSILEAEVNEISIIREEKQKGKTVIFFRDKRGREYSGLKSRYFLTKEQAWRNIKDLMLTSLQELEYRVTAHREALDKIPVD